ncbi:hypothetical protein CXX93_16830 [Gordonia sp. YC-JH1]|nr:hypothetical protein CXX93_16830 [Gordonia sp. YC-JH1]
MRNVDPSTITHQPAISNGTINSTDDMRTMLGRCHTTQGADSARTSVCDLADDPFDAIVNHVHRRQSRASAEFLVRLMAFARHLR